MPDQKKRILIIAGIFGIFIAVTVFSLLTFAITGRGSEGEEEGGFFDQIPGTLPEQNDQEEEDENQQEEQVNQRPFYAGQVNALDSLDTLHFDGEQYYGANFETGIVYSFGDSPVASEPERLAVLPVRNAQYIFLTNEEEMEETIVYRTSDGIFRYQTSEEQSIQMAEKGDYVNVDGDYIYYLIDSGTPQARIVRQNMEGRNERTVVKKNAIDWFSVINENIFYRSNNRLYRVQVATDDQWQIATADSSLDLSLSKTFNRGIINQDGKSFFYQYDREENRVAEIPFQVDLAYVVWDDQNRDFYEITQDIVRRYDWVGEEMQEWGLRNIEKFDIQASQIVGSTSQDFFFLHRDSSEIYRLSNRPI